MPPRALTPARAYVRERSRRASPTLCEGATLSWLFLISLPLSLTERGSQEGDRDGEIIGIEGEKRLTQSLMSFLDCLGLFLGQGPLAEDVGGPRTIEQTRKD